MDFYSYYKERFTWGSNPYASVAQCQLTVMELMDNPRIPFRLATESAVGFLSALHDIAGDGCTVGMPFNIVQNALIDALQRAHDATEAMDMEWCREMREAEQEAGGAPIYDPGDYEVWPIDLEGEDEEPNNEPEPDGPDSATLDELYGSDGETGSTGTRRPWPDWEHIASWTQTDWIKMQTFKSKMLAAAGHDFFTMGPAINALAAAKEAMPHIPLPRQVELSMLAVEIVDGLIDGLETNLQTLCAGSLHTHQGRHIQKGMPYINENQFNQALE